MKRVCTECGTDLDDWVETQANSKIWNLVIVACTVFLLAVVAALFFSPNDAEKCSQACGAKRVATWQPFQRVDDGKYVPLVCTCTEDK